MKASCAESFTKHALCLEQAGGDRSYKKCRKTQAVFDACMKDNLGMDRPHFGYHMLAKVHQTDR